MANMNLARTTSLKALINSFSRAGSNNTPNLREDHFCGIADTANSLGNDLEINIEPYHPLGSGKSAMLGKKYALEELTFPSDETVKEWIEKISKMTSLTVKKA